jgi:hypothetical protein
MTLSRWRRSSHGNHGGSYFRQPGSKTRCSAKKVERKRTRRQTSADVWPIAARGLTKAAPDNRVMNSRRCIGNPLMLQPDRKRFFGLGPSSGCLLWVSKLGSPDERTGSPVGLINGLVAEPLWSEKCPEADTGPSHSMRSSAVARSVAGIVIPSLAAVLMLITVSKRSVAWTGSSLIPAPRSTRSIYDAALRYWPGALSL